MDSREYTYPYPTADHDLDNLCSHDQEHSWNLYQMVYKEFEALGEEVQKDEVCRVFRVSPSHNRNIHHDDSGSVQAVVQTVPYGLDTKM